MPNPNLKHARLLIVDDEPANVRLLQQALRARGYSYVHSTSNPYQVLPLFASIQPDLVLLDLMMPGLNGYEVMEQLKTMIPDGSYLPILVLTADTTQMARHKALSLGAKDFLTKPFDLVELSLRVSNLIETRFLHRALQNQNQLLDKKVQERTQQLEKEELETIECLALAAEYRDDNTGQHTRRVAHLSALLADKLELPTQQVSFIRQAAPLHDVGKIGIPDAILLKDGKLTAEEFAIMQQHTLIGASILARHQTPRMQAAAKIAISHHERWDGTGYPLGLRGEEIPIEGRIVAVADVFDALTQERPYKKAWPAANANAEIANQSGRQFDPEVVEAFLEVQETFDIEMSILRRAA